MIQPFQYDNKKDCGPASSVAFLTAAKQTGCEFASMTELYNFIWNRKTA
jgi:hypothetical protein